MRRSVTGRCCCWEQGRGGAGATTAHRSSLLLFPVFPRLTARVSYSASLVREAHSSKSSESVAGAAWQQLHRTMHPSLEAA